MRQVIKKILILTLTTAVLGVAALQAPVFAADIFYANLAAETKTIAGETQSSNNRGGGTSGVSGGDNSVVGGSSDGSDSGSSDDSVTGGDDSVTDGDGGGNYNNESETDSGSGSSDINGGSSGSNEGSSAVDDRNGSRSDNGVEPASGSVLAPMGGTGFYMVSGDITGTYSTLEIAVNACASPGTYTITLVGDVLSNGNDPDVGNTATIASGVNITLTSQSSSGVITKTGDSRHLIVNGTLTLTDVTLQGQGYAYGSNSYCGGVEVNSTGALVVGAGAVIEKCSWNSGAVYVNGGTLTLDGGSIRGNVGFDNGGGVQVRNGGTVTLNSGDISSNTANSGGGIDVRDGTLTMVGGTVDGNSASNGHGGGICVPAASSYAYVKGGTISNNTATSVGGGISITDGGAITMTGGSIMNNTGIQGGGIRVWAYATVLTASDNPIVISGNHATGNGGDKGGGGVYSNLDLTLNGDEYGITIENNTTDADGGGIKSGNNIIINSGTNSTINLTNNTAGGEGGGGVSAEHAITVNGSGGSISFTGNTANGVNNSGNGDGGGFRAWNGPVTITGGTGDIVFEGNTASRRGGSIWTRGGMEVTGGAGSVRFEENSANSGGGIFMEGNLTITGDENNPVIFKGNTAIGTDGGGNGNGGGINGSGTTWSLSYVDMTENKSAAEHGGAIFTNAGTFNLTNVNVSNNEALAGDGGGIRPVGSTVTLVNTIISGNKASVGGGISTNSCMVTIDSGSALTGNTASGDGGGGKLGVSSSLTVNGGSISGNEAGGNGGGLLVDGGSALIMPDGEIIDNEAGNNGGGLFFEAHPGSGAVAGFDGQFQPGADQSVTIQGNSAGRNGGGIFSDGIVILDATNGTVSVSSNQAENGAGFAVSGGTVTGTNATVEENIASGNNGGGGFIINSGATVSLTGGTVSNNSAPARNGGGVYVSGGAAFIMSSGQVAGNSSGSDGGGIYNEGTLTLSNGLTITENTAALGGGVYVGGSSIVTATDLTVERNEAIIVGNIGGDGGGFFASGGTITLNSGVSVNNNQAAVNGGGIRTTGAVFHLNGAVISNNQSENGGGISANLGSIINLYSGAVTGNTASKRGGGIIIDFGADLNMSGGEISGNVAAAGAGVMANGLNDTNWSVFTMTGGTVTDNTSRGTGGGARMENKARLDMSEDASITLNTSGGNGGGVYVETGGRLDVTASASITNNTAGGDGGGIYTDDLYYGDPVVSNYQNISIYDKDAVSGNAAASETESPDEVDIPINFDEELLDNYQINYQKTQTSLNYDANVNGKTANPDYGDGKGGTHGSYITQIYGDTAILAEPADLEFGPNEANYGFYVWNTQADGRGISYTAGSTVEITAAGSANTDTTIASGTTLYAIWRTPAVLLDGYIFLDTAAKNGLYDNGEGLAGIVVELYMLQDGEYVYSDETTTDQNGLYEFGLLPGGTYQIRVPLLATVGGSVVAGEAGFITKGDDADELASHVSKITGYSNAIEVPSGTELWIGFTRNAGYAPPFIDSGILNNLAAWQVLILSLVGGIVGLFLIERHRHRSRRRHDAF